MQTLYIHKLRRFELTILCFIASSNYVTHKQIVRFCIQALRNKKSVEPLPMDVIRSISFHVLRDLRKSGLIVIQRKIGELSYVYESAVEFRELSDIRTTFLQTDIHSSLLLKRKNYSYLKDYYPILRQTHIQLIKAIRKLALL